jgi:dihydroorotase
MKFTLQNGRVMDPASHTDKVMDVHIAAGQIVAMGKAPDGFQPNRVIDASDKIVSPGLVDLSARLREPGEEYKASIASETSAAAAAGITTLCCPPDTLPVVDTPAVAELIQATAEEHGMARVVPLGALTRGLAGEQLAEIAALKEAGCPGVSNVMAPMVSSRVLRRAMEYTATFDMTLFIYPMDAELRNDGCVHEGSVSTRLGLPGIPEAAETAALANALTLIEQTGVRAHFCHLSSGRSVTMIEQARAAGFPVTADVAMHHLFLTEHDIWDFDAQCHVIPPLRTDRDRDSLRGGLANNSLSALCSDHQPHEYDAKLAPFGATEPGISALETLLPLGLRLVSEGVLDMMSLLEKLSFAPAQILGLSSGQLQVDGPADICIIDPQLEWQLDDATIHSQGKNTPFLNWHLKGRATHTLFEGHLVYELKHENDS